MSLYLSDSVLGLNFYQLRLSFRWFFVRQHDFNHKIRHMKPHLSLYFQVCFLAAWLSHQLYIKIHLDMNPNCHCAKTIAIYSIVAKSNHICITIRMNTNKQWIISQDNIHGILVDILTCVSYLRVMRWLFLSHTVILLLLLFSIGKRRLLTGDIHTWAQGYGDFDSSI